MGPQPSDALSSSPIMGVASDVPLFNKAKHISYWLRCLRSPLPTAYTPNDSNRMTLAFFLLSALDVLGVLFTRTTDAERNDYVDWIYSCQHPRGGFRSFPACPSESDKDGKATEAWDPPNLPATYFALSSLAVLGDDLTRVDRASCLDWLRRIQDPDGNFGELLTDEGETHGGKDTRYAYFAACIRWYLRGGSASFGDETEVPDIEVDRIVHNITACQSYDGGISGVPHHEAHAGFTWCAIAALSLLGRVEPVPRALANPQRSTESVFSHEVTVKWLSDRLTTTIDDEDVDTTVEDDDSDETRPRAAEISHEVAQEAERGFEKVRSMPASRRNGLPPLLDLTGLGPLIKEGMFPTNWTGFNGRCNKMADTCYAFWCGASLKMLDGLGFVDVPHLQAYLLEKTQHLVGGGFGKLPGDLPDIYHAYLGLAALAIINGHRDDAATLGPDIEDADEHVDESSNSKLSVTRKGDTDRTIRELDSALCISRSARLWIESQEWRKTPVYWAGKESPTAG